MQQLCRKSVWQDTIYIKLDGSKKFGEAVVIGQSPENWTKYLERWRMVLQRQQWMEAEQSKHLLFNIYPHVLFEEMF